MNVKDMLLAVIGAVNVKDILLAVVGTIGGALSWAFGGWSSAMITLLIFMAVDYATGLIVAGVFKKSQNSDSGALESRAGFKGLCKKGVVLLIVLVAAQLDRLAGSGSFIRDAVVIAFISNEALSIIENAGLMGIPIPAPITRAIEALRGKDDKPPDEG